MFFKNRKINDHLKKHFPPMTGDEFVRALGMGGPERELAIAVRKVIASMCRLEPDLVHPDASFRLICRTMRSGVLEGWDTLDFILRLEREIKLALPIKQNQLPDIYQTTADPSVGDWIREASLAIQDVIHDRLRSS